MPEQKQEKLAHLESKSEKVYQVRLESGLYWGNHEEVGATLGAQKWTLALGRVVEPFGYSQANVST